MKLRQKVTASMTAAFAVFLAVALGIQRHVVFPSFEELEREQALIDVKRAEEAVQRELEHLELLCRDWAARDDASITAAGARALAEAQLDVAVIYDAAGRRAVRSLADGADRESLELPASVDELLPPGHGASEGRGVRDGYAGLVDTDVAPLLIALQPLRATDADSGAMLLTGRLLDDERLRRLGEQTRVPVTLHDIRGDDLPGSDGPALAALIDDPYDVALQAISDDRLAALAYLRGADGEPVCVLRTETPRDVTSRGDMAVGVAVGTLAIASALVLGLVVLFLQVVVVGPLARLTESATRIGRTGDLDHSVATTRPDEIGVLSREVDGMVQRLARSRTALMEAARESGMAQVASGVLHNVGNVLNSLNVSTDVLIDGAKRTEMTGLDDLDQLLQAQGHELPAFLADPERAAQVREFVSQLADLRKRESQGWQDELVRLQANLAHVAQIVGAQQSMARRIAVKEPVSAAALVHDAASMVAPAFARHDVELIVEMDNLPTIVVDRVQLLQVLVNLLTNSKDAVKPNARGERRVWMSGRRLGSEAVRFEVSDNGVGIEAEALENLFVQGFTTKRAGTGFGLHFCAVTVKSLGGSIEASSDGPGQGASFTVRLPVAAGRPVPEPAHA